MARGRMYAKTVSTSRRFNLLYDVAGKLAEFCQALYPLLIAHADDSGRLQGDVETVRLAVCPGTPRKNDAIAEALTHLHNVNLIGWYDVEGRKVIQVIDFEEYQPGLKNRGNSKFPEMPQDAVVCREMPLEQKGTEQKGTEQISAAPLTAVTSDHDPLTPPCKIEAFVQLWNTTVTSPIPQCKGISAQRREKIRARLKERPMGEWLAIFQRIEASGFCHGRNDRKWIMPLDWLIKNDEHALRVLEGKYDDRSATPQPSMGNIPDAAATRAKYLTQ